MLNFRPLSCLRFFCLAALVAGCHRDPAPAAAPPPAVVVSRPLRHQVTDWDEYTGHLQSPETATVQARVSGFIAGGAL